MRASNRPIQHDTEDGAAERRRWAEEKHHNAVSEGLKSKIQTIKKEAYGFRNRENFKTSIFFQCGGLNLYPVTHKNI
jgi:hypothetical protein